MKVAVLGGGSWGTALAHLAGTKGFEVAVWAREREVVEAINEARENPLFLPGIPLPTAVRADADPKAALRNADLVLLCVPSQYLRSFVASVRDAIPPGALLVSCSKGIENTSLCTMHEVLLQELPSRYYPTMCVLSGPSFAREVAMGYPTNVTVASHFAATARSVQQALSTRTFRPYTSADVVGVEVGGAAKNVIAIAAGASDGLGYGHNSRAGLITRGLAEITRLAVRKGANPLTMSGLAGMGDLVLTCTGELSRNRLVGKKLAEGLSRDAIIASMNMVAEGIENARSVRDLARRLGVEMPITEQVYLVLHEGKSVRQGVEDLLSRPPGDEISGM